MLFQKNLSWLFFLIISVSLTACGAFDSSTKGGGLPDSSIDEVAPTVLKLFPETESIGIEVDSEIRIVFSELMNETSVVGNPNPSDEIPPGIQLYSGQETQGQSTTLEIREQSILLTSQPGVGIDPVTGNDTDIDQTVATLRHISGRFALDTEYTVKVLTLVHDLADKEETNDKDEANYIESDIALTFTTEKGEWKTASFLNLVKQDPNDLEAVLPILSAQYSPVLSSNGNGDTYAVWQQQNILNSNSGVWVSKYLPNEELWTSMTKGDKNEITSERLDINQESSAFDVQISTNSQGEAVVVWSQAPESSVIKSIWFSFFDGDNWTNAEMISSNQLSGLNSASPKVGIDDNGNIVVLWLEIDGVDKRVKVNQFDAETKAWLSSIIVLDAQIGQNSDAKSPSLSVSASGTAMILWSQELDGGDQLYASRYSGNSNATWEQVKRVDSEQSAGAINSLQVKLDKNNNAFAIWQQSDGKRENIWLSRYSGDAWSNADFLEEDNRGDAIDPFITFGYENQAVAVWVQFPGTERNVINVKPFSLAEGWGDVEEIGAGNIFSKPSVRIDREGNAFVVAVDSEVSGNIVSSRYSELTDSWGNMKIIESFSGDGNSVQIVPLYEDGRLLSVWSNYNADNGVFNLASTIYSD